MCWSLCVWYMDYHIFISQVTKNIQVMYCCQILQNWLWTSLIKPLVAVCCYVKEGKLVENNEDVGDKQGDILKVTRCVLFEICILVHGSVWFHTYLNSLFFLLYGWFSTLPITCSSTLFSKKKKKRGRRRKRRKEVRSKCLCLIRQA
jgi:hypothetical protein